MSESSFSSMIHANKAAVHDYWKILDPLWFMADTPDTIDSAAWDHQTKGKCFRADIRKNDGFKVKKYMFWFQLCIGHFHFIQLRFLVYKLLWRGEPFPGTETTSWSRASFKSYSLFQQNLKPFKAFFKDYRKKKNPSLPSAYAFLGLLLGESNHLISVESPLPLQVLLLPLTCSL